jgi:hypothetical protein
MSTSSVSKEWSDIERPRYWWDDIDIATVIDECVEALNSALVLTAAGEGVHFVPNIAGRRLVLPDGRDIQCTKVYGVIDMESPEQMVDDARRNGIEMAKIIVADARALGLRAVGHAGAAPARLLGADDGPRVSMAAICRGEAGACIRFASYYYAGKEVQPARSPEHQEWREREGICERCTVHVLASRRAAGAKLCVRCEREQTPPPSALVACTCGANGNPLAYHAKACPSHVPQALRGRDDRPGAPPCAIPLAVYDHVMVRLSPVEEQRLVVQAIDHERDMVGLVPCTAGSLRWFAASLIESGDIRKVDPTPVVEEPSGRLAIYCQGDW